MAKQDTFRCRVCSKSAPLTQRVHGTQVLYCKPCSNAIEEWIATEGYSLMEAVEEVQERAKRGKRGEQLRPD